MLRFWHFGAWALGTFVCLTALAQAGDSDTFRLDMKGKYNSAGASTLFEHNARALPVDDDVEDVHYRYWRGYNRGYYGTGYYLPRLYAFRSGYWNGYYGGGYYPRYYGSYYSYYPRSYYYPTVRYYYPPVYSSYVTYYYPCSDDVTMSAPTITLTKPRMPDADEPPVALPEPPPVSGGSAPAPRRVTPMAPADQSYPYDGPMKSRTTTPNYRYDGGPSQTVPMPLGAPSKSPPPKIDPKDGRLVSIPATKKVAYPAYGDHRRTEKPKDDVLTVKRD